MRWAPGSRAGTWAVVLCAVALAAMVLLVIAFALGMPHAQGFTDNWLLAGWGAAILGGGAASATTGALALTRRGDRSWLVLASTLLALLVTVVVLNEIAQGLGWVQS